MSNPNNSTPGLPSNDMMIMNWTDAQARSKVNSDNATARFVGPPYALGQGSNTVGSFVTNGKPPNAGNTP